jgi:hypothetical protein
MGKCLGWKNIVISVLKMQESKSKPIVIEIPEEDQQAVQEIIDTRSPWNSRDRHSDINGRAGFCCIDGKIATKMLRWDVSDAEDEGKVFRVERYCQNCYQRWVVECKDKKVKLLDTGQRNETIAVRRNDTKSVKL